MENSQHQSRQSLVESIYGKVDFQYLPSRLEDAYRGGSKEDHIFLSKFLGPLRYYRDFVQSFTGTTGRNVPADDQFDLYAYMQLNSSLVFTKGDEISEAELQGVLASLERFEYVPEVCRALTAEFERGAVSIYSDFKAIGHYIMELCAKPLRKIEKFLEKYIDRLKEGGPFIGKDLKLVPRKVLYLDFFEELSVLDRYELAEWEESRGDLDLTHKPTAFVLLVRLLLGESLPKQLYYRHPHLVAVLGDQDKIVEMIVKEYPEDDGVYRDMRLSVAAFSEISGLNEAWLVSKCLESLQSSGKRTSRSGDAAFPSFLW